MFTRIAALWCCLSLVPGSVLAADNKTNGPAAASVVTTHSGPIRRASLGKDPQKLLNAHANRTVRPIQDHDPDEGNWMERHPVWTGAILGFATGYGLTYLTTGDEKDFALFWGGVTAGIGALAGWGIGRNSDDGPAPQRR